MRRALALALLLACHSGSDAPTSVLLVTLDTTRADHAATPMLRQLAQQGLQFLRAYAPAPITLPAHASILTGTYPVEHGVRDNGLYRLDPECLLLSEVLDARGFATGAAVGSFVLDPGFGLNQGFDSYDGPPAGSLGGSPEGVERPADAVVDAALRFLDSVPADRPFFLWVHLYDPHEP